LLEINPIIIEKGAGKNDANAETWLGKLEDYIFKGVKSSLQSAINMQKLGKKADQKGNDNKEKDLWKDLLKNVGQSVVLAKQIQWTEDVEKKLDDAEAKAQEGKSDKKSKGDNLKLV